MIASHGSSLESPAPPPSYVFDIAPALADVSRELNGCGAIVVADNGQITSRGSLALTTAERQSGGNTALIDL